MDAQADLSVLAGRTDHFVGFVVLWLDNLQLNCKLHLSKNIHNLLIAVFKECFFFNAKRGYTTDEQQLGMIMMSLSYSPTPEEVHQYFQKYIKGNKNGVRNNLLVMNWLGNIMLVMSETIHYEHQLGLIVKTLSYNPTPEEVYIKGNKNVVRNNLLVMNWLGTIMLVMSKRDNTL